MARSHRNLTVFGVFKTI